MVTEMHTRVRLTTDANRVRGVKFANNYVYFAWRVRGAMVGPAHYSSFFNKRALLQ